MDSKDRPQASYLVKLQFCNFKRKSLKLANKKYRSVQHVKGVFTVVRMVLKFVCIAICFLMQISFLTAASITFEITPQESEIFNLTNQAREKAGLLPLKLNSYLMEKAREQSSQMAKEKNLSHTIIGSLDSRIKRVNYPYRQIGENIALSTLPIDSVIQMWMESKGHRKNILNPKYKDIGIGISVAKDGVKYYTQVFGTCYE